MKKKIEFFSHLQAFKSGYRTDSMVSLGNSFEFPALISRLGWRVLSAAFPRLVNFSSRLKQLHAFAGYVRAMTKHHGPTYTVNYLKACQLAVQRAIAGNGAKSLREINPDFPFPRLSRFGLPRFIPKYDQSLIKAGSPSVIRW
jgi:hypothetical protein